MRAARWRWVLIPMVVVVAGCLPPARAEIPAEFVNWFGGSGATFTVRSPPFGETLENLAAVVQGDNPDRTFTMFGGRAIPVFGLIDCHGSPACTPGPGAALGDGQQARTIWAVFYPDCNDANSSGGGWVVADAVNGPHHGEGSYWFRAPCDE